LIVLAVCAACAPAVTPTQPLTTTAGATGSPFGPTSSGLPTTSLPALPTPTPTPAPLTTISHEGETATVTLELPVSLIPPGTTIGIEDRPLEDAPRDVRDAGVRQAFHVLEPQALTFAQPVRVTVTMPRSAFTRPDGSLAITLMALRSAEGDWHWLADSTVTVAADTVTLSGLTTHLGALFIWSDLTDLVGVPSHLSPQPVGQSFRAVLALRSAADRSNPVDFSGTPELVVDNPDVLEIGAQVGGPADHSWTCVKAGDYKVTLTAQLHNFGAETPFLNTALGLPATGGTLTYVVTGECVRPTPTAPPPTASPTPSPPSPSPSAVPSSSVPPGSSPSPSASPSASPTPNSSPSSSP
jgi:hypothetical protein